MNKQPEIRSPLSGSMPDLVRKEALAALVALAAVSILAAGFDPPLEGPADATGLPSQGVKAPWIFVGIQQLLRYLPAIIAGVILPLAVLCGVAIIPFIRRKPLIIKTVFFTICATTVALTLWGYLA
jgi:hypothetical protein